LVRFHKKLGKERDQKAILIGLRSVKYVGQRVKRQIHSMTRKQFPIAKLFGRARLALCLACALLPIRSWAATQLEPAQSSKVIPQNERERAGKVIPLTNTDAAHNKILARGLAPIVNNDEKSARQVALRDAYRNAINQGVGTDVGHLFEMRNFKKIVDIVVTRSLGVVKSYTVVFEGRRAGEPPQYEILIEAAVGEGSKGDLMALALFLQVMDNPKVLLLIHESESEGQSDNGGGQLEIKVDAKAEKVEVKRNSNASTGGGSGGIGGAAEDALTKYFHDAGYVVLSSKEALTGDPRQDEEVGMARDGYAELARKVGTRLGADVVLCGGIRISGRPVVAYGVSLNRVHVTSTVRALVTASGQILAVESDSYEAASELYEAAKTKSINSLAKGLGEKLVWKIPEVLANQPRQTTVVLGNCTLEEMKTVTANLSAAKGVESVRAGAWTRDREQGNAGKVALTVSSGFLGATADDLYEALKAPSQPPLRLEALTKYNLELSVKRNGSP
jgi:hypothetical protein